MKKIIEISNCSECPNVSHTGVFTKGGEKPCCNHPETVKLKGFDCFERVIPYKSSEGLRKPKSIPKWCPLKSSE